MRQLKWCYHSEWILWSRDEFRRAERWHYSVSDHCPNSVHSVTGRTEAVSGISSHHCTEISHSHNVPVITHAETQTFSTLTLEPTVLWRWVSAYVKKCTYVYVPLVLWHCWLGVRKSIWPLKIEQWCVDVVICLEWGADCLHMVQLMPLPSQNSIISCLVFKSRLVLPFWYWFILVVLEKRPLTGCSSVVVFVCVQIMTTTHRGLKIKVIGQRWGLGLKSARMVIWPV